MFTESRAPVESEDPRDENADDEKALREDAHLARFRPAQALYVAAGTVCLGLGLIGVLLPLLPTTPFLLLAAFCYARGSERFYLWLMTNRYFGAYIRAWRENEAIPLRVKLYVLLLLWLVLGGTVVFVAPLWWVKGVLVLVGVGVTVYIGQLPTR